MRRAALILLLALPAAARADWKDTLKALPLKLEGGKLEGDGGRWLAAQAREAQFVLLGEEHNNRDLPALASAFLALHKDAHLHVEGDPFALRAVAAAAKQGGVEAVTKWARDYPNALAFMTDEELGLLAAAARLPGAGPRLSGGDQVFGALHVLDRLLKLAPPAAKKLAQDLRDEAAGWEQPRFARNAGYLERGLSEERLEALAKAFGARPDPDAAELLDGLAASMRIYRRHARPETVYDANLEREERMRRQFIADYAEAARVTALPRFLLKYGDWHLLRGINKAGVHTLGAMIHELAEMNGTTAFAVKAWLVARPGERGDPRKFAPWIAPFADAADPEGWTVFDLRPLRALAATSKLDPELERYVFGFDAFIFLGKSGRGSFSLTEDHIAHLYPTQE